MRPAIRLAAIMGMPVIYVWTHDSVWLGEDGPTHQPIEHMMALRLIPNLVGSGPCDAERDGLGVAGRDRAHRRPDGLHLTRQGLPTLGRHGRRRRGARGLRAGRETATGRDPDRDRLGGARCARGARDAAAEGIGVRVVWMPSWELFAAQDAAYREQVLPAAVRARVSIEAGLTAGWERWVGDRGRAVGIDRFGASAPGKQVARKLGITPEAVVEAVKAVRNG